MKNILIIQTAFLGDVVLITPLLSALKEKFPEANLSVLVTPTGKEILACNPAISEIIVYDKKVTQQGFLNFLKIVKNIKEKRFDIAVLPHRSMRSALLTYLANIPVRIGFKNSSGKIFLTHYVDYLKEKHEVERNLKLLDAVKMVMTNNYLLSQIESKTTNPNLQKRLQIYLSQEDKEFACKFLESKGCSNRDSISDSGINSPLIGLNPGSVWATKRWLPERFAEVGDRLANDYGAKIIIFGTKQEAMISQQVIDNMKIPPISAVGQTNLKQLTSLIKMCNLFITNDSGPMHLAMAVNTPTVAIFGPTTLDIGFGPYGENFMVVEKEGLKCRPCGLHGPKKCPKKHFACMKEIGVTEVVKAASRLYDIG